MRLFSLDLSHTHHDVTSVSVYADYVLREEDGVSLLLPLRISDALPLLLPSLSINSCLEMFKFSICIRIASIG